MLSTDPQAASGPAIHPTTSDTGLMVLSMSRQVLHLNGSAQTFLRALDRTPLRSGNGASASVDFPDTLNDFFQTVLAQLEKRIAAEDWSHFEFRKLLPSRDGVVLVRGFGIPDAMRRQQSRIILMLQQGSL